MDKKKHKKKHSRTSLEAREKNRPRMSEVYIRGTPNHGKQKMLEITLNLELKKDTARKQSSKREQLLQTNKATKLQNSPIVKQRENKIAQRL